MRLLDLISEYFLNEAGTYDNLDDLGKETADEIMKALGLSKDNIVKHAHDRRTDRDRIVVKSDEPRAKVFADLAKLGYKRERAIAGSTPGGYVAPNGVQIIHKPYSKSNSRGTAGLGNEMVFVSTINNLLAEKSPMDVVLRGDNKSTTIKGVTEVVHIGKEGEKQGWKGDAKLVTSNGSTNVSIKEDGKYRWESVIKRYREVFEAVMRKGMAGELPGLELKPDPDFINVLMMWDPDKNKPYGRIIVTDHPQLMDDFEDMAFGPDKAVLAQRSFTEEDFRVEGDSIVVDCTEVAESLDDFTEDHAPVLEFERNSSKASKNPDKDPNDIYGRGVGMRTTPYKHAKGGPRANQFIITYEDLMK